MPTTKSTIHETKIDDYTYQVEIKKGKTITEKDRYDRLKEAVDYFINRKPEISQEQHSKAK